MHVISLSYIYDDNKSISIGAKYQTLRRNMNEFPE